MNQRVGSHLHNPKLRKGGYWKVRGKQEKRSLEKVLFFETCFVNETFNEGEKTLGSHWLSAPLTVGHHHHHLLIASHATHSVRQ